MSRVASSRASHQVWALTAIAQRDLTIGSYEDALSTPQCRLFWTGSLDEVSILDEALSADDVLARFRNM